MERLEFSRLVEEEVAGALRLIEATQVREGVESDVITQLSGQHCATTTFYSITLGRIVHKECASDEWRELYHRIQLAILTRKEQHRRELKHSSETKESPSLRLRWRGRIEALRFLYITVERIKARIDRDIVAERDAKRHELPREDVDEYDTAARTCTSCRHKWEEARWLDEFGRCVECRTHDERERRRQKSRGTLTLPIPLCRGCRQVVTESGLDDQGYCLECVEYEFDAK